jgi:hypothetical protein
MAKLTLNTIGSRYGSIDALNDNFDAIEQALENTFSLDGTIPNALEADLDLNNNDILNAGEISTDTLRINGVLVEPTTGVTAGAAFQTYEFTATAGQTTFSVSPATPYNASIVVIVNGLQLSPAEVSVSGTNIITPALTVGDEVVIRRYIAEPVAAPDATEINFIQAGTGAITRNVQEKLREIPTLADFNAGTYYAEKIAGPILRNTSLEATGTAVTLGAEVRTNYTGNAHAAGTVGTVTIPLTIADFTLYRITFTLSTTVNGNVAITVGGVSIFDDYPAGLFYNTDTILADSIETSPILSSTVFSYVYLSRSGYSTPTNIVFTTDTLWGGSLSGISVEEVSEIEMSLAMASQDDPLLRQPIGPRTLKLEYGTIGFGDRLTVGSIKAPASAGNGAWNTAFGVRSLASMNQGVQNVAIGPMCMMYTEGSHNTALGYSALKFSVKGQENTALGYKSFAANGTGSGNTGVGFRTATTQLRGAYNTAIGHTALPSVQAGDYNTAIGYRAGIVNIAGSTNTYVGALAGYDTGGSGSYTGQVAIGAETRVYGIESVSIGHLANVGTTGAPIANAIAIGYLASTTTAATTKIGNGHTGTTLSGKPFYKVNFVSDATATGITYTAAQFVAASLLTRTGPTGPVTDVTPTAAQIVAAIPGCEVGTGYDLWIRNGSTGTITVSGGAGVVVSFTNTITAGNTRHFKVNAINITPGSESVNLVCISQAAN